MTKPENVFTWEDLFKKSGYRTYTPRMGNLGRALLQASKGQKENHFLKRYFNSYFKKLRQRKFGRKK